jgi:hypothetical protein
MWRRTPLVLFPLAMAACGSTTTAGGGSDAQADVVAPLADAALQADAGGTEAGGRCEAGAGAGAAVSPDASACSIALDQYDRSCSVDSDCVSTVEVSCAVYENAVPATSIFVRGGDFCGGCNCAMGFAINRGAAAQYAADVSATPQGSGQVAFPICNCAATPPPGPLCVNGMCGQ